MKITGPSWHRAAVLFFAASLFLAHSPTGARAQNTDQIKRNMQRIKEMREDYRDYDEFVENRDICFVPIFYIYVPKQLISEMFAQKVIEARLDGQPGECAKKIKDYLEALNLFKAFDIEVREALKEEMADLKREIDELEYETSELQKLAGQGKIPTGTENGEDWGYTREEWEWIMTGKVGKGTPTESQRKTGEWTKRLQTFDPKTGRWVPVRTNSPASSGPQKKADAQYQGVGAAELEEAREYLKE